VPTLSTMVMAWLEAARHSRESMVGPCNFDPGALTPIERKLANEIHKADALAYEELACITQQLLVEDRLVQRLGDDQFKPVPETPPTLDEYRQMVSEALAPLREGLS
jgi:hypothetical protein